MTLFSQRKGFNPVKSVMQIDSMDDDLRNGLWNALTIFYWNKIYVYDGYIKGDDNINLFRVLWLDYFKLPIDTLSLEWNKMYKFLREHFFEYKWNEVYDFIEFLISIERPYRIDRDAFINYCNNILQREVSAYRVVGDRFTEITSEEEVNEIEEAFDRAKSLKPVYLHLKSSIDFLSDRKSPNYRNSIKESISAVEAICNLISKGNKATLGQTLKEMEKKIEVHPALKKAFDSLYGYTSDAEGIRHALLKESNLDFEDAKFMLVSCSAFINYLIAKSSKIGIKL